MRPSIRLSIVAVTAVVLAVFLGMALAGMPRFGVYRGPYGDLIVQAVENQLKTVQAVNAIVFNYRGLDTMGEEMILFACVTGTVLLLRPLAEEKEVPPQSHELRRQESERPKYAEKLGSLLFLAAGFVWGWSIIIHGHLGVGGGFQGGVILASAMLYLFLGGEVGDLTRITDAQSLDEIESSSAASFVLVGLIGLCTGVTFLGNMLPLGETNNLLSAGTLPPLSIIVGCEVAAGFLLVIVEYLRQSLATRQRVGS